MSSNNYASQESDIFLYEGKLYELDKTQYLYELIQLIETAMSNLSKAPFLRFFTTQKTFVLEKVKQICEKVLQSGMVYRINMSYLAQVLCSTIAVVLVPRGFFSNDVLKQTASGQAVLTWFQAKTFSFTIQNIYNVKNYDDLLHIAMNDDPRFLTKSKESIFQMAEDAAKKLEQKV